jgi:hypothetical protein
MPDRNARVCEHSEKRLRQAVTGNHGAQAGCSEDCLAIRQNPANVVCPFGFWCMNRVIEWHAFTPELAEGVPSHAEFGLDIDGASEIGEIRMSNSLIGYTTRISEADPNCMSVFEKAVTKLSHKPVFAVSWNDWRNQIQKLNPALLLLLVHTKKDQKGTSLELGSGTGTSDFLTDYIDSRDVCGPKLAGPPIVLLLGCTTAKDQLEFATVAARFETAGAGIIVATTNLVYGPRAVELAQMFLEKLDSLPKGESFGDVMLEVRREALSRGIPMVLCLAAYGDADWRIVKG